jgi:CheY-like chemotaxis protein
MSNIILCADDSKTMQTVAEITFRVSDYQYVGATSADEALEKARVQKPALILADAAMPRKDGYELCRAVKDDPALADVPVIMMCGNSSSYDAAKGAEVGADGHLNKPWDTQSLLDKVAELLQAGAAKGPRAAAKPAAQPARPAVVTQPPILPAATPVSTSAATLAATPAVAPPRTATMIGMPQPLEPEKPRAGQPALAAALPSRQPGVGSAVDNAQPLAAPLPPRLSTRPPEPAPASAAAPAPAAAPAARPVSAAATPAARPPVGAPIGRLATAPPVGAAAPAATPSAAAGTKAPARPASVGAPTPAAARPPVAATPAPAAARVAPAAAAPAAVAATRPAAVAAAPAARVAPAPAAESTMAVGRPPMIRGQATRRSAAVEALLQGAVARGAAAVAREAGLDPAGPEMRALLALSVDVVERIVWEVVPELAELIIRENLADLAAAKR